MAALSALLSFDAYLGEIKQCNKWEKKGTEKHITQLCLGGEEAKKIMHTMNKYST